MEDVLRVTAFVLRFCHNIKLKSANSDGKRKSGSLSVEELKEAELYWIKEAQLELFQTLKAGAFKVLTPFVDSAGILRVGGRVEVSLMSYENCYPALLPNNWIATLITREAHQIGRNGVAATSAKVRRKYWIIQGPKVAKMVKKQCTFCKKIEKKFESQLMAKLPWFRQKPFTPPFLYSSCDYFGPMHVKVSHNKTTKTYGVIFTCLNTRAVHCKIAIDASTMEMLQVLRRFFAVRGYPELMISDNGSQMVGAEKELRLTSK